MHIGSLEEPILNLFHPTQTSWIFTGLKPSCKHRLDFSGCTLRPGGFLPASMYWKSVNFHKLQVQISATREFPLLYSLPRLEFSRDLAETFSVASPFTRLFCIKFCPWWPAVQGSFSSLWSWLGYAVGSVNQVQVYDKTWGRTHHSQGARLCELGSSVSCHSRGARLCESGSTV